MTTVNYKLNTENQWITNMTKEEFDAIKWTRNDKVKLTNGKIYPVIYKCSRNMLLLTSKEFKTVFTASFNIIQEKVEQKPKETPKKKRERVRIKKYTRVV